MDQVSRALLAAGGGAVAANWIEDVFQTWLYSGNDGGNTITNGIDLSGKGGLVWIKSRNTTANHVLTTEEFNWLKSNTTDPYDTGSNVDFLTNGFYLSSAVHNANGTNYASWTFRKQPKFFDVVTYTGNGANYRAISHSLGSTPGMVIVKSTSASGAWAVWHRSVDPNNLILNSTSAAISGQYSIQDVSSTSFAVADSSFYSFPQSIPVNDNGETYVAYLFAHDAGGFGAGGTDNVISCGSFTTDGSGNATVTLGYEPQWVMVKSSSNVSNWAVTDSMREMTVSSAYNLVLVPNSSAAENTTGESSVEPTATGFYTDAATMGSSRTYIYIAIRRGPMRTPTTGTSVFSPIARTGTGSATTQEIGLNGADLAFTIQRAAAGNNWQWADRLRSGAAGNSLYLQSNNTNGESHGNSMSVLSDTQTTIKYFDAGQNNPSTTFIVECFRRAPGFFDVVCYTGNGLTSRSVAHNLGVAPEFIIVKNRINAGGYSWAVWYSGMPSNNYLVLNGSSALSSGFQFIGSSHTSSVFSLVSSDPIVNGVSDTYVAYLFASCPGVSKVGSYTGNGSSQTINCGFTTGARFVLIKRTDSTGDWYVWDTARGIVSANDPHLSLNSTAAEVTTNDSIDPDNTGFIVNQVAATNINVSSATYIFLAIA